MLDIQVENHGNYTIVTMAGEFFLGNVKEVDEIWDEQLIKHPEVIAFDCSKLSFIDSSAIGTLVKFLNNGNESKTKMVFLDLSKSIVKIFRTAKLNKIFPISTREEFIRKYHK